MKNSTLNGNGIRFKQERHWNDRIFAMEKRDLVTNCAGKMRN